MIDGTPRGRRSHLSYTKCFEAEQQIYNLEYRPVSEDGEEEEWPEFIEG
jgi:hypothetical protein